MSKTLLLVIPILLVGLFSFLWVKSRSDFSTNEILQSRSNTSSATTLIGTKAQDFHLTTIDGEEFQLSGVQGKTVILFGMAGWCGTCIPEGRALTQIKKDYSGKGVEIIGVAFTQGDNDEFLKEYRKIGGIDIPIALDSNNVAGKYQLTQLETTYIINKEGVIVYKDEQFTDYEDYKRAIDKII